MLTSCEIDFFTFDRRVFLFVQQVDRRQGSVLFHDVDPVHIRRKTQGDALFCKTAVYFVLDLVDRDHAVGGYPALYFQKEGFADLLIRKPADQLRFGEVPFLRGFSFQGRMLCLIVMVNVCIQASAEFIQRLLVMHVEAGHPLVFHGPEPSLNLGFLMLIFT